MTTAPAPISIFDVDRTLTRLPTYSAFLIFAALRARPWRLFLLPIIMPWMLAYAARLIDRRRLKAMMYWIALGRRLPRKRAERIGEAFAEKLFQSGLYHEAIAKIRTERADGRRIMLATAAPELYIRPLASRLGISDVIATSCRWSDGHLDPAIEGDNCYGAAKLAMIGDYFQRDGIDRRAVHVRAYSDHASDLPMLEWANEPVAVNASARLRRIAETRGWPTLDWKSAEQRHGSGGIDARRIPA